MGTSTQPVFRLYCVHVNRDDFYRSNDLFTFMETGFWLIFGFNITSNMQINEPADHFSKILAVGITFYGDLYHLSLWMENNWRTTKSPFFGNNFGDYLRRVDYQAF